jgi:hypothetical protein
LAVLSQVSVAPSLVMLSVAMRRRVAATRAMARMAPILSPTPRLVTTSNRHMAILSATVKHSTSKRSTLVVDAVRSTHARSKMNRVAHTATSRKLRPQATVAAAAATSATRSAVCRVATSGNLRTVVRALTVRDSTTTRRKSKYQNSSFYCTANKRLGDVVSPISPKKMIPMTTIPTAKTHTRSVRGRSARGERRKRRRGIRRNTVAVMKTRVTMLTSVVQVPTNTGAVRDLASRSTGARRARAHPLSVTLAVISSLMMLAATDRSAGMVKRARLGMVANKRAPDMANSRSPPAMVASKKARATVIRSLPVMEVTHMVLAVAMVAVRNLPGTREAMAVDVALEERSLLAMTECLEGSVVMTSLLVSEALVKSTMAAAAMMMMMSSMANAGRREAAMAAAMAAVVATEARRRAMAAGIRCER